MDNSIIIRDLISSERGKMLSMYAALDIDILGQKLCAYLNGKGGDVIIGIGADHQVVGVSEGVQNQVSKEVVGQLVPSAPISIQAITYVGKEVLLISVWSGARKPYSFRNKIFTQEKDNVDKASPQSLKKLSASRKQSESNWERQTVLGADIEDLDQQEIKKTIKQYITRNPTIGDLSVEDFLLKMGLLHGGSLTNAAIVLFAETPTQYLPQCKIRATIYNSSKADKVLLFDRIYNGSLFKNIQSIWDFYETHLMGSDSISGLHRTRESLPLLALREGLLNAIIHRDYSTIASTINIEVYPDRLVLSNTGSLPKTISAKDLEREHNSILRNPDIANICYLRGYIEMLGTGTLRMIADCVENGISAPVWESLDNRLKLTLKGVSHRISDDGVSDGVNDGVNKIIDDGLNDGVIDGISDGVREEVRSIINIILENEGINTEGLVQKISGKSKPTIERYLRTAKQLKMIIFKGAAKTGGYFLTEKITMLIK